MSLLERGDAAGHPLEVPPVDMSRIAESPQAVAVLRQLAERLRTEALEDGPSGHTRFEVTPLLQFTSGKPLPSDAARQLIGSEPLEALLSAGAAVEVNGRVAAAVGFGWAGRVPVAIPLHQLDDVDRVYIGAETPWLTQLAFRHGPGSGRALELAAGTGAVAVALTALYDDVTATDLLPESVACCALTFALNAVPGRLTRAIVADVADGLPSASFDLVVGNPPWVPTHTNHINRVYADGGATGMELPALFVAETKRLLRPDGVGIMIVSETRWSDGNAPLDPVVDDLRRSGFDVTIERSPDWVWSADDEVAMQRDVAGCVAADVVAVVFQAPSAWSPASCNA